MTDTLDKIFNVAPVTVHTTDGKAISVPPEGEPLDVDFDVTRQNHYNILDTAEEVLHISMRILREEESVRAVEVVTGVLKAVSDINKQLLSLNKIKTDIKQPVPTGNTLIKDSNVVFTGNMAELKSLLKNV